MAVASDYAGLYQWLVADSGGYGDQSGNGRHATAGGGGPPILSGTANGHAAFYFDSTTYLNLGNLSALTSGEIFIVVARRVDTPTDQVKTGIATFGTNSQNDCYPWTDGNLYIGFGSTNRFACGNPSLDMSTDVRVLNVWSAPGSWGLALDGSTLFSTTSNTAAFTSTALLGKWSGGARYLEGYIPEYALFSAPLSAPDRAALTASLMSTYQGALVGVPPTARVTAAGVSAIGEVPAPNPRARVTAAGVSALAGGVPIPNPNARVTALGLSVLGIVANPSSGRTRFYIWD